MKLRFLNGREQGKLVDLKTTGLTLGRDPDNDLMLTGDGISRHHGRITAEAGQFFIEDLQSTNGVRVNGQPITAKTPLAKGDHIGLGAHIFQVTESDELVNNAMLPAPAAEEKVPAAEKAAVIPDAAPAPLPDKTARTNAFPWLQALIIFVLLSVLIWVVFKTFFSSLQPPTTLAAPAPAGAAATTASATPTTPDGTGAEITAAEPKAIPPPGKLVEPTVGTDEAVEPGESAAEPQGWVNAGAAETPGAAEIPLIVVTTEPPGATVKLDDKALGQTPLVVRNMAVARHTLVLNLSGYEEMVRQIHPPAVIPDRPYVLRQKPGTLRITTVPSGAVIQQGTRILGQTPLLLQDLPEGEYELWAGTHGYDPVKFKAAVTPLRPETVNLELKSRLGNLEVTTYPAGCEILLDETVIGKSLAGNTEKRDSQPFLITGLIEGDHEVRIQHPLGSTSRARVQVVRGETRKTSLKLWVLDTEVVLDDGTKRYGMLIEKNPLGDIILGESSKRLERYLKIQIAQINPITPEKSKELLKKLRVGELGPQKRGETAPEAKAPTGPAPAAVPEAKPAAGAAPRDAAAAETAMAEEKALTVEDLVALMRATSAAELRRKYTGKDLTVTGIPALYGKTGETGYVTLGSRARFEFSKEEYDTLKEQFRQARDERTPLTLRGKVADYANEGFTLKECEMVEE